MPYKEDRAAGKGGSSGYEYNTLMNSLQVSVSKHLLDQYYTMIWGNDFYYKMIHYPKDEYEARFHNRPDLYYTYHGYGEELKKVSAAVTQASLEGKPSYNIISRMPVREGGHIWVRMAGTFTEEYIGDYRVSYTVITDIDDLIQMRTDRSITYNSIPGFVAKLLIKDDFQFELLDANDAFRDFFHIRDSRDIMNPLFQKNLELNRKKIHAQAENITGGKPIRFLAKMESSGGQTIWMQVNGECVDWVSGRPVYLLIYIDVTDLTELREMQKQLEEQAAQLRRALSEAENANRAKSDFLSRMSHDIRTPMNAIMGMTEIARAHLDNQDKTRDCLRKIAISSQHLLGLINDVLDMSKIESGKMTLRDDIMFLPEFMENVVAIIQPMVKSRRQKFSVRLHRLEHERYYCDSLRLRQCFINILSNASKFTPEGGSITVDMEENGINPEGKAELTFTFSDTGIGIKPEFMEHLFDAFTREMDGRVDKTEGSGLGMAITKKIVDLMGGTINVESGPGKGTTFLVRLPLLLDNAGEEELALPALKVLIADDDEIMCEYTAQTLTECGMEAEWVTNGRAAVERIVEAHQSGKDFDAIILDWRMPDQDGLETVKKIRTQLKSSIPIMIISAYDWTEIEQDAEKAGVNGFLPKPLFRSTLCRGFYRYVLGKNEPTLLRDSERDYDFSGRRILLVEDNEMNREIAVELLAESGASVDYACDGAEGVEKYENSPLHYYDLILMDVQMPVMDGYTATRKIRGLKRGDAAGVPILAMTADAFSEDVAAALESGMNGHLAKPLDVTAMKYEISKYI